MSEDPSRNGVYAPDPVFEQVAMWPLRLIFLRSDGLTLWGTGADQKARDRVLTVDGDLVLCADGQVLRDFIAHDAASALSGLPGYAQLRAWARAQTAPVEPELTFDYRAVAAALEWPVEHWDRDAAGDLLDAMNMLYDVAASLEEHELLEQLDAGAYGAIVDGLTFVEEEQLPAVMRTLDLGELRRLLGAAVDRIERRIRLIPAVSPAG